MKIEDCDDIANIIEGRKPGSRKISTSFFSWIGIILLWIVSIIMLAFPPLLILLLPVIIYLIFKGDYNEGDWKGGLGYW